jgi:hypothetical protein
MSIAKIYVDMDGVLCNFEKRYQELYGDISQHDRRTQFRPNFNDFIETKQFATLEPMPDFPMLKSYLDSLSVPKQILSSTAYENVYTTIKTQKEHWLSEHHVTWPDPQFVPGKHLKYKFATHNSIIIDDTLSVIEDWRKAGGIAIWHKDAKSTIAELEIYLKHA